MPELPEGTELLEEEAPRFEYRGLPFRIEREWAEGVPGLDVRAAEVSHDFFCHSHTVKVWLYGTSRDAALMDALRELYLIVIAHHATCGDCQACVVYGLIGTDERGEETDVFGEASE